MTNDPLEVPLEDDRLVEEIGLLTDLIVVASDHDGPLDTEEVDALLGLSSPEESED
jgi:hypothetical protein